MRISKHHRWYTVVIIWLTAICTGCASIGNIVISPHPKSLKEGSAKLTLHDTCPKPYALPLAAIAAGVVVAGVQKFLEEEAKQYTASYSGSDHNPNLKCVGSIELKRSKDKEPPLFLFKAELDKEPTYFSLTNGIVEVRGVKSKVAAWPLLTAFHGANPWSGDSWSSKIGNTIGWVNPIMIFHAIYGIFDPDIYKVDIKTKVKIDAVTLNSNQTALTNLADITIPTGKVDIFDISNKKPWTNVKSEKGLLGEERNTGFLKTGYLAFPIEAEAFGTPVKTFPTNVVITGIEGNEFGDTIGKGAKLIGDKKDGITDKLKEWFGG